MLTIITELYELAWPRAPAQEYLVGGAGPVAGGVPRRNQASATRGVPCSSRRRRYVRTGRGSSTRCPGPAMAKRMQAMARCAPIKALDEVLAPAGEEQPQPLEGGGKRMLPLLVLHICTP